jgi:hypothetical protein
MKFNISKKQWTEIGIKHGWKKYAQQEETGQFVLSPPEPGQPQSPSFVHPHYITHGWDFNDLQKIMKYLEKNHPNAGKSKREVITVKAADIGIDRPLKTALIGPDSGHNPIDESQVSRQYRSEDRKFFTDKEGNKHPVPPSRMIEMEHQPTDVISIVLAPQSVTEDFKDEHGVWKRKTINGPDGKPETTGKTLIITAFAGGAGMPEPTQSTIKGHYIFDNTPEGQAALEKSKKYWSEHALATGKKGQ